MAAVLIIGGGIAGAASAIALRKAGIKVTVYEAHPHSSLDAGARPAADRRGHAGRAGRFTADEHAYLQRSGN